MPTADAGVPATMSVPHQGPGIEAGLPIAAILCAVLLWGSSFAAMGYALKFLNPWSVMWLRMVIPLIILLPLAGRLTSFSYQRGDWKLLLPMVLFQPCLYFLLESNALRLTTSSQAGVVAAFVPLLVAVGAFIALGEPLGRRSIVGTVVSLAGVVCLTLMQSDTRSAVNPYLGNAMELCAMVCAAGNMLMIKKLCRRYNVWTLTAMQIAAGTVFFLPGLWYLLSAEPVPSAPGLVQIMLYLPLSTWYRSLPWSSAGGRWGKYLLQPSGWRRPLSSAASGWGKAPERTRNI